MQTSCDRNLAIVDQQVEAMGRRFADEVGKRGARVRVLARDLLA